MDHGTFIILLPCYNDWESINLLLSDINNAADHSSYNFKVIIVNDGSSDECCIQSFGFQAINLIVKIELIRNLGHQRAICIGLSYIYDNFKEYEGVIVMDSDGEDDHKDIFSLIRELESDKIIFAKRKKRSESFIFKLFYYIYKQLFYFLTGHYIFGGNFSLVPNKMLKKVIVISEIWNHYCAGIIKSKLKVKYVDCNRGKRYKGVSKMNFTSLIVHGLSSISVFNEIVFVRMTIFTVILLVVSIIAIIFVILLKITTDLATPGWATTVIGVIMIICIQFVLTILNFVFYTLGNRNQSMYIPHEEYARFISNTAVEFRKDVTHPSDTMIANSFQ